MRILIITDRIPYPPISGGSVRIHNILQRITKHHEVWLVALQETQNETENILHLEDLCYKVETAIIQRRHSITHLPELFRFALAGLPLELKFRYSKELVRKIQHLTSSVNFDVVQIEHPHMALYLEAIPHDIHLKSILMFHDIDFSKYDRISRFDRRLGNKIRAFLYSRMMRRWEPFYAERFGRCITVSESDRNILLAANPHLEIDVISNGVSTKVYQPLPEDHLSPALLFVGNMSYMPCIDGVMYFCREILPLIRQKFGFVEMWIVGKDPPDEVFGLNGDGVYITGQVDSVIPYYNQSAVCVVPLRAGGGTRLKILEAMALGRPVVSTSFGCEGLDVVEGEHLLIADNPEQFANDTIRLLSDKRLYKQITTNARQLVINQYDWDMIAERLMRIYTEIQEKMG